MSVANRPLAALLLLAIWVLAVRALGSPPRLEVEIEMTSEVTGRMQLFADDGRGFRQELSDRAPVPGNGRFATYRLALAPRGSVRALRLDPVDGAGRLTIRAVTVSLGEHTERFTGAALAGWKTAELRRDGSGWRSLGVDPRLVLERQWPAPWWPRLAAPPSAAELALAAAAVPLLVLALIPVGRRAAAALALASPVGLFLALNAGALGSWWIHDDPCLLAAAADGVAPHFWHPETWRALSGSVLMPWTILSLGVDAALSGLEPAPFYAHQLLSFMVLLALLHALLRRRLSPWASALALSLFAVSAPAFAVAQRLMNRHYVEGTIFFLGALALYWRAVRARRAGPAVAGAALYLLSVTAKEVFVPLVAVLPFLPVGDARARWRRLVPFAAVAALYVPWRLHMLGPWNSLSGYVEPPGSRVGALLGVPAIVGLESAWQVALATVLGAFVATDFLRRSRRWRPVTLAAGAAVTLPLLPVAGELAPRHFLLPALGAAVMTAAVLDRRCRRPVARGFAGLALLVLVLSSLAASPARQRHAETVARHRAEGGFVLGAAVEGVLLSRLDDPKYLACMAELRRGRAAPGRANPGFCGDACYCATALPGAAYWRDAGASIVAVEPPLEACAVERPLTVELRYDPARGRVAWRLGPYADGLYELLLVTGDDPPEVSAPVPFPAVGEAPLALSGPWRVVVGHRAPGLGRTYTPVLTLDPAAGRLEWGRGIGAPPPL